jgi:hypothetical protein
MNVQQLIEILSKYPQDTPVRINSNYDPVVDLTPDHVVLTSTTAYANDEAPEEEWDCDSGKLELGDGERFIMLNAPIL